MKKRSPRGTNSKEERISTAMAQKKTFKKDNPALSFISTPAEEVEGVASKSETEKPQGDGKLTIRSVQKHTAPEGYKLNPEYIETKSKRVQLLLQPSTVKAIKSLSSKRGLSMNEAINEAIQEYLHKEER